MKLVLLISILVIVFIILKLKGRARRKKGQQNFSLKKFPRYPVSDYQKFMSAFGYLTHFGVEITKITDTEISVKGEAKWVKNIPNHFLSLTIHKETLP